MKPATVIAWHRRGYAKFWAHKSQRLGRPPLAPEVIELIVRMAAENPTWSRRRIAAELSKLGHDVSKDSVAKYMSRPAGPRGRPPSTTWGTFVRLHLIDRHHRQAGEGWPRRADFLNRGLWNAS